MAERLTGLAPVLARHTRLVILGSFPGVVSLQTQRYYAHPRNAFWPLLEAIWSLPGFASTPYRRRLAEVRRRGLGLWDVYGACCREGSLDADIEAGEPNDLSLLKRRAPGLQAVAHNGGESARFMRATAALGLAVHRLPSSSPANASWSFERKREAWQQVFVQHALA